MSSTRYAAEGSVPRQERFASDPEYAGGINALLAAKRIALVEDPEVQAVLWYIQFRSLQPLGLRDLAKELTDFFPDRVGSPAMRRIGLKSEKTYGPKVVREIRAEIPNCYYPVKGDVVENWDGFIEGSETQEIVSEPTSYKGEVFLDEVRRAATVSLPEHLANLCLDPSIKLRESGEHRYQTIAGVWYFENLLEALQIYRRHCASVALSKLAETDISAVIAQTLGFCFRQRRMVLIEGVAGIGKTATIKAWCNLHPGLVRYVELPSSNDDRSFYAAIAEALGVARGSAYNVQQIKLRVEESLRASRLMLVLDEAQYAWPQKYNRPQGVPIRMQWIKTAFDNGTPIALVGLPEFSEWQALYVKKTLWRDSQFVRRTNRHVTLPAALSRTDLMKIACTLHPHGDEPSWDLLVGCALALSKKQASAIKETLISARDIAEQDKRDRVTYEDISAAMRFDFAPCDSSNASGESVSASAVQRQCKGNAATAERSSLPVREVTPEARVAARSFRTNARSREQAVAGRLPSVMT